MNNKIKLAVAGAVLSAASVANAGIVIPAGDWTIDINGNVNAFAIFGDQEKKQSGTTVTGGLAGYEDADGEDSTYAINTGLLPAWLGFTGTTRQNDLDVSFTISLAISAEYLATSHAYSVRSPSGFSSSHSWKSCSSKYRINPVPNTGTATIARRSRALAFNFAFCFVSAIL